MTPRTCRHILVIVAPIGWILACVFGVLACMLAADARDPDVPWQILGALVLGPMLAAIPVGVILYAANHGFGRLPDGPSADRVHWRWPVFAMLCGLEVLVIPLTLVAAGADDDSLLLTIPFNLVIVTATLLVGCWPHRRRAMIVICAMHLAGIAVATFAAAMEIGTVIVSGPLLLISGIALSVVGSRPRTPRILFALSTVAFIVISFLVIAIGNVSEREAHGPLFAAMVAYQILFAPIGLWLLYRARVERKSAFRGQFGLMHLIGVMVMVCVASGLAKLSYSVDDDLRIAVAVGLGGLVIAGIATTITTGAWANWFVDKGSLPKGTVA